MVLILDVVGTVFGSFYRVIDVHRQSAVVVVVYCLYCSSLHTHPFSRLSGLQICCINSLVTSYRCTFLIVLSIIVYVRA